MSLKRFIVSRTLLRAIVMFWKI